MKQIVKPNEVRVGNYIYDDFDEIHIVEKIESQKYNDWNGSGPELIIFSKLKDTYHGMYSCEIVSGIPLSPELLEKAGFLKETKPSSMVGKTSFDVFTLGEFVYNTSHAHFWIGGNYGFFKDPKYLHELQNLFFSLVGEELKIEL